MKVKYIGLTPVNNIYGEWKPGETKNITGNIIYGSMFIKINDADNLKEFTRRTMREELNDKMERDNLETRKTKGGKKK